MDGSIRISRRDGDRRQGFPWLNATMIVLGSIGVLAIAPAPNAKAGLGMRRIDPAQVVPLDQIAPEARESVAEVIRDHTFHRQGAPDTFSCDPNLYTTLIDEPELTLALWRDLSTAPVQLRKLAPNRYEGSDGQGASGTWDFVLRSPELHVMMVYFNYVSPRSNARIDARIVLVVRSSFYRQPKGESSVQHSVEAFVKVDSKGWKTVARTFRPVIEKALEDQVQEAGLFVSLMSKVVVSHPNWACQVIGKQPDIDVDTKAKFRKLVILNQRLDASEGRPTVAGSPAPETSVRR